MEDYIQKYLEKGSFKLKYIDMNPWYSIECGKGWFSLLNELIEKLNDKKYLCNERYGKYRHGRLKRIKIVQIKEKFYGLRFYCDYVNDEGQDLIHDYEYRSYYICENCGSETEKRNNILKECCGVK